MPMWRCPHCGTPQAETARCWVCRRSSTACGTCRHFRRSVAAQLGYCGLDRQRLPLHGDEIRACWEAATPAPEVAPVGVRPSHEAEQVRTSVRRIEFVEVGPAGVVAATPAAAVRPAFSVDPEVVEPPIMVAKSDPGWSLWSDAEL